MNFLNGLAGIGKHVLGMDDSTNAQPVSRFQNTMGNLSSGLTSLSENLMGERQQPQQMLPRRQMPLKAPVKPFGVPVPAPPGALSSIPYTSPDFAAGTGGGFVT